MSSVLPNSEADLIAALESAFPNELRPPDDQLVYDSTGAHDECIQVLDDYAGLRWTEVPSEVLGFNADALHFMTDQGFAYYLPAFIRKYLQDRKSADLIPQQLLTLLTPGEADPKRFHFLETRLSLRQKRLIVALLQYMRDHHPYYSEEAGKALSSYWEHATEGGT